MNNIFKDAKFPNDYIEINTKIEILDDLIEVEIHGDSAEVIWLSACSARAMGEYLIKLAGEIT